ncbi:MAG: hypothetical protein ACTSU3_04725 [Candidatus Thorarchaeota archaeon]
MITPETIFKKYEQFTKQPIAANGESDDRDSVFVLLETDWVRILLLKSRFDPGNVSIEIESYLPDFVENPADSSSISQPKNVEKRDMKEVANGMIAHLKYLIKLGNSGFELDFIGPDYLWTATRDIHEILDLDFFKVLMPPIES